MRAKPVDLLTIHWLLAKAIDSDDKEKTAGPQTQIIGPLKYARADDVYDLLGKVYKDQIDQNPGLQDFQSQRGFGIAIAGSQNRNVNANGQPRPVTLRVAVDEVSNSLIVTCSEAMFQDVKQLVDKMESFAKDNVKTVQLVKLNGIDPVYIQQAVEAFQGHAISVSPNGTSGASGAAARAALPG